MRYFDFLRDIQEISNSHVLVNEYGEGDIYEYLNSGEHKYPCVFLTVTNLTTSISGTQINFTLFYTDRLVEDNSNKKSIQSTGINVIKQVLSKFEQEHPTFAIDSVNYQPFTEKFADMCAGVFCNVVLENPTDNIESYDNECEEGAFELKTITLTANGIYDVIGYDTAIVEIPLSSIDITENGVYTTENGGYNEVVVNVEIPEIVRKVKLSKFEVDDYAIVDGKWNAEVIDTSLITSMRDLFYLCLSIETMNLTDWDVSNVEDMYQMFSGCIRLQNVGDISNWNTGKVKDMKNMFFGCELLPELNLSNWDVSNVEDMNNMFCVCKKLNAVGDLSNWGVSNVTNMREMFKQCNSLQQLDLSNWNTGNVTDMYNMFYGCVNLQSIGNLSNWDVSNVTNMREMFSDCKSLTTVGDLNGWDVSNVTNTKYMFRNCDKIQQLNVSNWKSDSLTEASRMFQSCDNLTEVNISNWEMSNLVDVNNMFEACGKLQKIDASNWIAPNLKDISFIFTSCQALTDLNTTGWDTSSVTNLWCAFQLCSSLASLDLSSWNVGNVTNMNAMFRNCTSLTDLNVSGWDTSNVTDMAYMFFNCSNLQTVDLTSWDASKVTDIEHLSNQAGIVNYVGGRTIDEVIENNITILNGLNVSGKHNIFSRFADRASVRALINGLPDLTGENFKILYLDGAYSKATAEDKAIATAKNWRIA